VESFDQSLKYLLQHDPADFLRFGLGDPTIDVVEAVPSDLPSRGCDVDAGYLIRRQGVRIVAHLEFHRRHQAVDELAIDVAEAQVRLFRRERIPVLSQVWDLYGKPTQPLVEERTLDYGAPPAKASSRSVYQRVNLRALRAHELLAAAPPGLWPLVALTSDGATAEAIRQAVAAIEGRPDLDPAHRADHLAVLWFVAEAEQVPVRAMMVYISEEKLMESALYKSIFEKGEARGVAQGHAQGRKEAFATVLIRDLTRRLGGLDSELHDRIRAANAETLEAWSNEAALLPDAQAVRELADRIRKTPAAGNGQR
jgi:predicted transposase YdaD